MRLFTCFVVVIVFLLLAGTTEATVIDVTLHADSPQTVTLSDGSGEYFDDWRIWESVGHTTSSSDDGSPGIADEKKDATNIDDLGVSQGTRPGGGTSTHSFSYTAADAESGTGATDLVAAVKLAGGGTPVNFSLSASDIGAAGTLYLYTGGYISSYRLDAAIGSDSDFETRSQSSDEFSDLWEVQYSGVTNALDTLDITITNTGGYNDLQFYAAALNVTQPIPEPSTIVLLCTGAAGLLVCVWRKRRRR